jgi:hypothetical protein
MLEVNNDRKMKIIFFLKQALPNNTRIHNYMVLKGINSYMLCFLTFDSE